MAKVIAVRLIPPEPVDAIDFTSYLDGLTISAFAISFANPELVPQGSPIGSASRLPGLANRIVQHDTGALQSVATAAIEIGGGVAAAPDVLLTITRGTNQILNRNAFYNITTATLVDPTVSNGYSDLIPGIYLTLPPVGKDLDPADPFVALPVDGSPPNFDALKAAMVQVLEVDPGGTIDDAFLATLTKQQALHVARTIVFNQGLEPLPTASVSLDVIYTGKATPSDAVIRARSLFEGELEGQYHRLSRESEALGQFAYALALAIVCQQKSESAVRVGFRFPVRLDSTAPDTKHKEAEAALFNP